MRHRRYSLLAVTVILLTLLAAGSPHSSLAAQQCTVQEEQRWRTLAAQFSVGSLSVKVTVPSVLVRSTTVYLETSTTDSARFDEKLLLESGSEKVVIANGAALHLAPRHGERITLSLISENGQRLCAWQPSFLSQKPIGHPAQLADGFAGTEAYCFRQTGDPIVLTVGGELANGPREFQIGGIPAMVLAQGPGQVILRDPAPMMGPRKVTSQRYSITLRFIDIEVRLSMPSSRGAATLTVRVPKLDLWGRHLWPLHANALADATAPFLSLVNSSPDSMKLLCGQIRPFRLGADFPEFREIRITQDQIRNGGFSASCPVRVRNQALAKVEAVLFEGPFGSPSRSAFPF